MRYCDITESVIKWAYEPPFAVIPYFDKGMKKNRHYYVDFVLWVKKQDEEDLRQVWVEIKPFEQTQPPKIHRVTESSIEAVQTYITNQCKWEAARKYCNDRGIDFLVITEKDLK